MPSPLYNLLGGNAQNPMANMVNQFIQFRNNFQGDPRQQVMSLLSSGRMSQQQFNQLQQMANQFQRLLK